MYTNGVHAYRRTNVVTADPKRLVMMCYEEAIRNLSIAREKYLAGEYETKAKATQKAQDIINELMSALDFEKGGEIARNLEALYNYMIRRILHAEVERDVEALAEVLGMLKELKGAWEEVFYGHKQSIKMGSYLSDESSGQVVASMQG
jgi:flagellar protein FliS